MQKMKENVCSRPYSVCECCLRRDFASRLFSFIRMTMPPYDIRASLWRSLIPKAAPLAADLDFTSLGRKFELFPVSIEAAIAYACSEVAARTKNPVGKLLVMCVLSQVLMSIYLMLLRM